MMKTFLSSTYVDLIEYRRAAKDALERLGAQVGRMEVFGARPEEPLEACLAEIEACDLFIGIYAYRYGHIPVDSEISITEAELRHAEEHSKPIFCFLVDEGYPWLPKMIEGEPGKTKLTELKNTISSTIVKDTFTTPDNLASKVGTSVGRYLSSKTLIDPSATLELSASIADFLFRLATTFCMDVIPKSLTGWSDLNCLAKSPEHDLAGAIEAIGGMGKYVHWPANAARSLWEIWKALTTSSATLERIHAALPSRHDILYGRDKELDRLVRFLSRESPVTGVAIEAIGGMGKTALARECCITREIWKA